MATKGLQGTGVAATNAAKAQAGQQDKADARRARKAAKANRQPVAVTPQAEAPKSQEALHALYSRTIKILGQNHISRNPVEILAKSQELRKACLLHGWVACATRILDACCYGLGRCCKIEC